MAKKSKLPPRPECGSIEINKIIRAINEGKPNPCTENEEQIRCYNAIKKEKDEHPERYFSLVEPDYYEDCLLDTLI